MRLASAMKAPEFHPRKFARARVRAGERPRPARHCSPSGDPSGWSFRVRCGRSLRGDMMWSRRYRWEIAPHGDHRDSPAILVRLLQHAVVKRNKAPLADFFHRRHGSTATTTNDHANDPMPALQAYFSELRRRMPRVRIEAPARQPFQMGAEGCCNHLRYRARCRRIDGGVYHASR